MARYQRPIAHRAANCSWLSFPDFRRVQSFRHAVHPRRRISALDQPFLTRWFLPVHGFSAKKFCASSRYADRVPCSLRRTRHWIGNGIWNFCAPRQRVRHDLHAHAVVLVELSGSECAVVAVLRSFSRSLRAGAMLWCIRIDQSQRVMVDTFFAAAISIAGESKPLKSRQPNRRLLTASRRIRSLSRK